MATIQVRAQHVSGGAAHQDVASVINPACQDEINPATAVTIASWWQSPGGTGYTLAGFASGCEVDRTDLLDDIAATRTQCGYGTGEMEPLDRDALDCLATFVINYGR